MCAYQWGLCNAWKGLMEMPVDILGCQPGEGVY